MNTRQFHCQECQEDFTVKNHFDIKRLESYAALTCSDHRKQEEDAETTWYKQTGRSVDI